MRFGKIIIELKRFSGGRFCLEHRVLARQFSVHHGVHQHVTVRESSPSLGKCRILPYITTSAFNSCPIFCGVAACEPNNEGATLDKATFKPCRCLSVLTSSSVTVGPRHWFAATPSHVIGVTASVCPALVHVV